MIDNERLLDLTQSYLKSLVSAAVGSMSGSFDESTAFSELGVDSFRVLKIIKALEADFGRLPKTLLFEHFNISDLSAYFLGEHESKLRARFAMEPAAAAVIDTVAKPAPSAKSMPALAQSILMTEQAAYAHPQWSEVVRSIFERHCNEGSVSRGTRNIAPNLFIGSERQGFFNYSRSGGIILAYTYTGPRESFGRVARELYDHCANRNLSLNLLVDEEIDSFDGVPVSSTPFGALQRIENLQRFTIDGKSMRRLRYQVSKFEKAGHCRTDEFRCGADVAIARNIADIIDQWCGARTMVNPLIHIVKDEILAGTLNPAHRIFITYVDDVLQNAILISPMANERNQGYLMDLEFYTANMPLGGLEFAIVRIIETLVAEGCDMLSLGGTYGCKLRNSANADAEVDKILDDLRLQNIFNDEGNLQFKNKFRPENKAIFLCRPVGGRSNPDDILDVIMMIADPMKMQTSDAENQLPVPASVEVAAADALAIEGNSRSFALAEHGFNPLNLATEQVDFDLKTDSWAQLQMPAIATQRRHLHAQLAQPADLNASLSAIFPFAHFALTASGRTAESAFCSAWPRKGVVLQNLLFPTTIFHQIDKGFVPKELPHPALFQLDSSELYKGNLDWPRLRAEVTRAPGDIAFVCVELSDNAAGGCPVSLQHLRQVKALLAPAAIALVIEGTRALENAQFLIENEPDCAGRSLWDVVREIFGYADVVLVSLAKNFCVNGGLIATNDAKLMPALQGVIRDQASGLNAIDKRLVALSLQDRKYLETQMLRRKASVLRIWTALLEHGVPVVQPAGGHCVLIDVKQLPEFRDLQLPVASFLAWLYLNTGIRAGAHSVGMQTQTTLNGLVRLAIPVGMQREQVDGVIDRLVAAFAQRHNIPEVVLEGKASDALGDIHARHRLVSYHKLSGKLSGAVVARPPAAKPVAVAASKPSQPIVGQPSATDVAVVGMAGRYPHAKNLDELWQNLVQGKDCIDTIPDARLEQRLHNGFTRRYRGGFIDDVDKFDARFFNVSPTEAAVLDPQERLFLEVACEAIEDAGYYPETLSRDDDSRDIGVFVGAVWSMYQMLGVEERIAGNSINPSSFFWSIANRVSYWMNLSGPSLTLDTACSASLTAIHLACEAIRRGECSAAIVGGVNLDLHQSKFDINSAGGSFSKDGVCRSFGKGANGYVSGEGVGALFLKPLAQAIADGDNIHGVIKGAAVTHSGRTGGYTIPGPHSQTKLILKALERANVDARSIGYIEAHGTGTDLGDSIELAGLNRAFQEHGVQQQSCAIGSVKTNIGHLEAASGIVGLQKVLLQMKHGTLVPSLHSAELNDSIDFVSSQFYVQQRAEPWLAKEVDGVLLPRRAGVSAIGAGGTNAHIILEEYQPAALSQAADQAAPKEKMFPLSAGTEVQLRETVVRLRHFLRSAPRHSANDVAHTLQRGRKSFDYRICIVAKTLQELAEKLDAILDSRADDDVMVGSVKNAKAVTAMLSGRELREFVDLLVRSGEPRRLSRLWSDGVILDWKDIDIGQAGSKVSLPTYPFAGERYWITNRKPADLVSMTAHVKPAPTNADDIHPSPPKRSEKYQFSFGNEAEMPLCKSIGFGVEDKSRLFVRQMFAAQLHVSIDDVDDSSLVMETGITSLDMAEMTQSLKERLDVGFSPIAFFECTTVRSFSELLMRQYPAAFQKLAVVRLEGDDAETVVPLRRKVESHEAKAGVPGKAQHVLDAASELPQPESQAGHVTHASGVLLTGATGFLGIHVLSELHSHADAKVHCLVRCSNKQHGLQRILKQAAKFELSVDEQRIVVLCGDINQPHLGLSAEDWEQSCRETRQIVHASAHVNHIEGYATFRDSAQGMKEVIRLAGRHQLKLIQFVSSIAGCALKSGEEFSIFEREAFIADGEHVYGGYGQSKWVQETFLRRAHEGGVPYVIYRFGELSGAARSGLGQTDDMLHRLLQMKLAIGCKEKAASDVLDVLPVDFAARLIVNTGKRPELWNAIVHGTHLQPYSLANVFRKAQSHGLQFPPVTRTQYLAKCYDFVRFIHSVNPVNGFVLDCVLRDAEGSVRRRKMMDAYFSVIFPFEQGNFRRALATLELALPEWNSLIDLYLERWSREDSGFMARVLDYQQWAQLDEAQKAAHEARQATKIVATVRNPAPERKGKALGKKSHHDALLLGKVSEA